jgi:FlaA1/EpsC-like NDP-sugar epimerase
VDWGKTVEKKTLQGFFIHSIKVAMLLLDIAAVNLAALFALMLRFDFNVPAGQLSNYYQGALVLTLVMLSFFYIFHLYSSIWRYASIGELLGVVFACLAGSSVLFILFRFLWIVDFPRSFYLIFWLLTVMLVGGIRFAYRCLRRVRYAYFEPHRNSKDYKRVMIIGGGVAGALLIKELKGSAKLNMLPVAIIDDDPAKQKKQLDGIPILGNSEQIVQIAQKKKIDDIIIAIPTINKKRIIKIVSECNKTGCRVRTLPGINEIMNDKIDVKKIKDVNINDLLGRSVVKMRLNKKCNYIKDGTILITGGGGSIGSELCRQIACFSPKRIVILDNYENNAYEIHRELIDTHGDKPRIEIVIASIQDKQRMERVFNQYRPTVVFHAAAHKHVPLMEASPEEAIKNNITGTKIVASCACDFGAERFILISTDKAVNPTNVMGATKRIAEMLIQALNRRSNTKFAAVRFGNVLDSNGSVIPIFKKQIDSGGPVTVTHPEVMRFFMTIPEAVQLVMHAGAMVKGGEVFVLDMGEPVKIVDLAKDLIRLSGLEPDKDIKIVYTGLRPGEKLYEELLLDAEGLKSTSHPNIFYCPAIGQDLLELHKSVQQLETIANCGDLDMLHHALKYIVPEYRNGTPVGLFQKEEIPSSLGIKSLIKQPLKETTDTA